MKVDETMPFLYGVQGVEGLNPSVPTNQISTTTSCLSSVLPTLLSLRIFIIKSQLLNK